mmetsp:Transcript_102153/g.289268  ORF Transcript_102153/g.289268 Transcript_102153/m.289268 type:complete len:257 (+) Transcript_102153:84-854(+)
MGCSSARACGGEEPSAEQVPARGPECPREDGAGRELPKNFTIRIHKGDGDVIGATLGIVSTGAVLISTQEGGVFDRWNRDNPDRVVQPGFIIEEVNGVGGYWRLLEVFRHSNSGAFEVRIATLPPQSFGPTWFEDIAEIARNLERCETKSSFMVQLPQQDPDSPDGNVFTSLPSTTAGAAGVDQCAICLEDVAPEEHITQFPCKHAYHTLCAARWLAQGAARRGPKRHSCPLCCRKLVSTRDGVVAVDAETLQTRG